MSWSFTRCLGEESSLRATSHAAYLGNGLIIYSFFIKRLNVKNQVKIFKTSDNQTEINVQFDQETVWLNQKQMAEL